jgi:hypothetical protein
VPGSPGFLTTLCLTPPADQHWRTIAPDLQPTLSHASCFSMSLTSEWCWVTLLSHLTWRPLCKWEPWCPPCGLLRSLIETTLPQTFGHRVDSGPVALPSWLWPPPSPVFSAQITPLPFFLLLFFFFLRRNDYVIWPTGKPTHINSAALHSESISFPRINLFFLRISGLIITHVWYPYISKPSHKLDVWEEILNLYIFYQLASKLTSHSPLLLPFMSHERWVVNVATHWHLMVSCLSLKNSHQLLSSASSQGWKYQQDREAYHVSHD